jgi:hypothetical protein
MYSQGAFGLHAPKAYAQSNHIRKRYCAHHFLNWLLPAWIFYFLGALGYLIIDMLSAVKANVTDYQVRENKKEKKKKKKRNFALTVPILTVLDNVRTHGSYL